MFVINVSIIHMIQLLDECDSDGKDFIGFFFWLLTVSIKLYLIFISKYLIISIYLEFIFHLLIMNKTFIYFDVRKV